MSHYINVSTSRKTGNRTFQCPRNSKYLWSEDGSLARVFTSVAGAKNAAGGFRTDRDFQVLQVGLVLLQAPSSGDAT